MTTNFLLFCCLVTLMIQANAEDKMECTRNIFKETIEEMTEFTDIQMNTLQNISPETKKKLKAAIMDVLSSLGLLLEVSIAPTFSLNTLPIYIFRAQNLMKLLNKDIENLKPEAENMSESLEKIKHGLISVVQGIPMKAIKCFQS